MTATDEDFDTLVRDHRRMLVWSAYHRVGEKYEDAEDTVQNALLKAWEQRNKYVPIEGLPMVAWVANMAKYEAYATLTGRRRYVPAGDWAERFADREDRATDTGLPCSADPETCAGIYAALTHLSDQQRLVIQMHCLQNMERPAVGECLRMTIAEVGDHFEGGMKKLLRRKRVKPTAPRKAASDRGEALLARPDLPLLLDRVSPSEAVAFRLRYIENVDTATAARRMRTSAAAAGSMLSAALARLERLAKTVDAGDVRWRDARASRTPPGVRAWLSRDNRDAVLQRFGDRHAAVLRGRYIEGLLPDELAVKLGVSVEEVHAATSAAARKLRKLLAVTS